MTILNGVIVSEALSAVDNVLLSADLSGYAALPHPTEAYAATYLVGTVQSNLPVTTTPINLNASIAGAFFYDYYFRVHIAPTSIALGTLANTTQKTFVLWNAFTSANTLVSLNSQGTLGLSVADFSDMPSNFPPLVERSYTLTATLDGPATINAEYRFIFSSGATVTLDITGQRLLVFPFKPNWENGISETLEWKTDVLKSYDDSEQRRKLRSTPRRGFEYNFLVKNDAVDRLENLLMGWHQRSFALPVWTDKTSLDANAAVGSTILQLDTRDIGFENGTMAILYNNSDDYEAVTIGSFTNSQMVTSFPLQKSWPRGSAIYPIVVGNLPSEIPLKRHTDSVVSGRAVFTTNPDITPVNLPLATAPLMYDGLEVITQQPNWKNGLDNNFVREFYTVDFSIGIYKRIDKHETTRITRPFGWLLKNKTEIMNFRKLLQRLQGQLKTCWIPSWHNDFKVVEITPANVASLIIGGTDFYTFVGVNTTRDRIMLTLHTGEVYYRKIVAMTLTAAGTQLGLDLALPIIIRPENVRTLHILLRCRMATDKVEIPWRTDSIADPTLTFTTVKL